MSLRSISRFVSSPNPANLQPFARFATASSPAEEFHNHLRRNAGQLEKTLAFVNSKLDPKCVTDVIDRCDPSQAQMGLRFFVWAGLQQGYRHTPSAYEKACNLLKINQNPKLIYDVVEAYKTEKCLVNVKTFKLVLNLCKEAKLADEALWVLRKMSDFGLRGDSTMYGVVIRLFCRKGDVDAAVGLMKEMTGSGDLFVDTFTLSEMAIGLCEAARFDEAFRLFGVAKRQGVSLSKVSYTCLVDGLCKSGDVASALAMLEEMERGAEETGPNTVTYTCIVQRLCEEGRVSEATEILDRMESRGCFPNDITAGYLIRRLCEEGRVGEVHDLIRKVVGGGGGVSIGKCYSIFVVALARTGRPEEAEEVYRKMIAAGLSPDGMASSAVIREICSSGRVLEGYRLCLQMEEVGCLRYVSSDVCTNLLAGLFQQEHSAAAVELAELMLKKGIRPKGAYAESVLESLKRSRDGNS